ncbi:MAG: pirin family protein [Vicinamibacteria bacterium]|nr:pirin family protein [Vicinamibacteria bacterium]
MTDRTIEKIVRAVATSDGAGVRLSRAIANAELDHLDPFLLLDEFRSDDPGDYIAGFPDHPHRGFETVTYMLAGKMEHADHAGNRGLLTGGGAQWMTAGRGIIHSETPKQDDGLMWGFQLWVNLPAKSKMTAPRYQDIDPSAIPEVKIEGGTVRVIAGTFRGATGPVQGIVTDPVYLDVRLEASGGFETRIPEEHTAFLYAYQGNGGVGGTSLGTKSLAVLSKGERIVANAGDSGFRFLCVAARPLNEPIARYGPFVMNTREEIHQAFEDFRNGRFA